MSIANRELFEYGILTEASDIRAHVSVVDKTVYVFPTAMARAALNKKLWPIVHNGQPGVEGITCSGWLVKIDAIDDIRQLRFNSWTGWDRFTLKMSTSAKGALAVECVIELMRIGRFPIWFDGIAEDLRREIQIGQSTDILLFCNKRIQVKCDYEAGRHGNLYLQKAERNPLKKF